MSESTTTSQTGPRQQAQADSSSGASSSLSTVVRYVRKAASSGLLAGATGAINLARARRALRNGSTRKATRYGAMGAFWLAVAAMQWQSKRGGSGRDGQSGSVDQTDVVDTAPDIEDVSSGSRPEGTGDATPIEVADADRAPDVEGDVPTEDVEQSDVVDTEPDVADDETVEDVEDAGGVEDARNAEGMENVEDAEGVTDVEDADGTADENETTE